ncbi:MAG TPA: hypothetical protein VMP67_06535 [Candidatus Limnocylindria bacterium]|nr:hypothetical protein [Candidatus Limnocylindria bacterium]
MPAVSAPHYRPARPAPTTAMIVAIVAAFLVLSLLLLGVGVLIGDVLARSAEPLLTAPFRWEFAQDAA